MDYANVCLRAKKSKIGNKEELAKITASKLAPMFYNIIQLGPRMILRGVFNLMRANMITRLISVVVLLVFDIYNLSRHKISKKQFIINVILAFSLLVGGTIGWVCGQYAISVVIENITLAIIGGIIGAGVLGGLFGGAVEKIIHRFIKSDFHEMLGIYNKEFVNLCKEYNINRFELSNLLEMITITPYDLKTLFLRENREVYAYNFLEKYFVIVKEHNRNTSRCIK